MKAAIAKSKSDTSGIHLWLVLWKAFRSVEEHAQRHIAGLGLGLSDFGVLEALFHKGPLHVKDLGPKVMLTSGSMTAALDRLERRGLIDREEDSEDRRARLVRLTETGERLIREVFEEHKRAMELATSGVGKRDRELLIDLLRQLGLGAVKALYSSANKGVAAKSGGKKGVSDV
ncbi:MarR family transcriptional regulator [Alloacidobacterium dinghuense]|uniref:MarR family transcriptional regulator n=1 Tax=Alloacidobacterium dinghuense TaxID=2763107 RepID=A0A7G8BKQ8_9BACT|nr:MarR family transcriptional regulator [Alloacidobacterium dinghuense]QNI33128.1 MarR family transcriptional regulator [Alloacidobacterium dinghuense]